MLRPLIACALLALPAAAQAQDDVMGTYMAYLGPEDLTSSTGVRLTSAAAILRQDRANYHKFGIRHDYDEPDPWFDSPEARALLQQVARIPSYTADVIEAQGAIVVVSVRGRNGRITSVTAEIPG